MPDEPETPPPAPAAFSDDDKKKKKKKGKVRNVWISFTGRIIAQVLGAAAAVVLGILVIHHSQTKDERPPDSGAQKKPAAARISSPRRPGEVSLAVLPLQSFSTDPKEEYFADGMTEALITALAQIDGLRVISRTSSMFYKGQRQSLPEIAQALSVDLIVEGSIIRDGPRVRVTAQLIDAKSDEHLWANQYDRAMRDILTIQAEVATAIAREVEGAMPVAAPRRRSVDPVVYDLYLRGRHAWNQRTPDGFEVAIRHFQEAVAKDPEFAHAHAGLADAYHLLRTSVYATQAPGDLMARAKAAAERAVALDDSLAEAHTSLAFARHRYDWDWPGAEREFRRALELNPGYVTGRQWYAIFLAEQGRDREALAEAERAVSLDPLSAIMHMTLGFVHHHARRFDRASAAHRRALELDPRLMAARVFLATSLLQQGNAREAILVLEQAGAVQHPQMLATLSGAYSRAQEQERAAALRRQLFSQKPLSAAAQVRLHSVAGDKEALLSALNQALGEHSDIVTSLKVDPIFDIVRSDRRFTELLDRLRLNN
jgi:TolB-like protein/Tfp pilus assembly protein PilF